MISVLCFILMCIYNVNSQTLPPCSRYYRVIEGDYPYLIAMKEKTTYEQLLLLNNNFNNQWYVTVGMVICVEASTIPLPSTITAITTTPTSTSCGSSCIEGCTKYYKVIVGEYAYLIAMKEGTTYEQLLLLNNNFNNQWNVSPGMIICVAGIVTTPRTTTTTRLMTTSTSPRTTTTTRLITTSTTTITTTTTRLMTTSTTTVTTTTTRLMTTSTTTVITTTTRLITTSTTTVITTTTRLMTTSTTTVTTTTTRLITTSTTTITTTTTSSNLVSYDEYIKALVSNAYQIPLNSLDKYNSMIKNAGSAGGITTKRELAMFFAQILVESAGLKYVREVQCEITGCPGQYEVLGSTNLMRIKFFNIVTLLFLRTRFSRS
jgi:hypothetical protein